jgi:alkylated DNA repair dioxygenase AlkB
MQTFTTLGGSLRPEFITESDEVDLILSIRMYMPSRPRPGVYDRNAIVRFGSSKPFKDVRDSKIPVPFDKLCARLAAEGYTPSVPDAITINEYYPGQAIRAHIDPPQCGPVITVLSLAAPATMVFSKEKQDNLVVELPPRSLVQMRDAIRDDWQHEIQPVRDLRYSIVFRCSEKG